MPYLLTMFCACTFMVQGVLKKLYGNRSQKGIFTFSTLIAFAALLFFAVLSIGKPYTWEALPYALGFGAAYAITTVTEYEALSYGSLAITSMIMSYSLIIPTICGVLFWNETLILKQYIGLAILCLSLFLIRGKDGDGAQKRAQLKWLIYILIAFVCNGFCTIFQRQQQRVFNGKYDESYMVMALIFVVLALAIMSVIREREDILTTVKLGGFLGGACGICNGVTNLLVMLVLVLLPASVFFPVLSALALILSTLASVFLFKERLLPRQFVALFLGCVALVLVN